ncbi:MAG: hypothetical protein ACI4PT_11550 [Candidatus Avoscillospira sp.]
MYDYVEDSICLQLSETPEDFYESAMAFGSLTCVELIEAGYLPIVIDNLCNSSAKRLERVQEEITGKAVPFYEGDIRDYIHVVIWPRAMWRRLTISCPTPEKACLTWAPATAIASWIWFALLKKPTA